MVNKQDNQELNDDELNSVTGGMKIILINTIEKFKKEILDIYNKLKRKQRNTNKD